MPITQRCIGSNRIVLSRNRRGTNADVDDQGEGKASEVNKRDESFVSVICERRGEFGGEVKVPLGILSLRLTQKRKQ